MLAYAAALGINVDLFATRATQFNLSLQSLDQVAIVPGLLHEVVNTSLHRFNSELNRAPAGKNDNRQRAIQLANVCY